MDGEAGLRQRRGASAQDEDPSTRPPEARPAPAGKSINTSVLRRTWKHDLLSALAAAAVGWLSFRASLDGEFIFDDFGAIVENRDVTGRTGIQTLLGNDFWGNPMRLSAHKSFRPLTVLSFRMNFEASGGRLDARAFHITNLALHSAVSALLVPTASLWIFPAEVGPFPVAAAALLFASHPVHSEAVAGLVGRADILSALLFLLSLLLYFPAAAMRGRFLLRGLSFVGSLAAAGASTLSKEIGITVLALLILFDACHNQIRLIPPLRPPLRDQATLPGSDAASPGARSVSGRGSGAGFMGRSAAVVVFGVWAGRARVGLMEGVPRFTAHNNFVAFIQDRFSRYLTYWHVYSRNAALLLYPHPLCCDWSMGSISPVETWEDSRNIGSVLLFLSLAALAATSCIATLTSFSRPAATFAAKAGALLALPFIPASNLFFPVGFVLAERVLYIPSIGFAVLSAGGLAMLAGPPGRWGVRQTLSVVLSAAVVWRGVVQCSARSADWRTSKTLFESGVKVNPKNAKLHYNLGHVMCGEGRGGGGDKSPSTMT
ncbi:hypothetical protein T484DRAFT_1909170, partial [Baffinella frigidus]